MRAWKHLRRLESPAAFGGWLRQIALNVWLDHARRSKIRLDEPHDGGDSAEAVLADAGAAIDLERALGALRPAERVCVVLCFREGMSHGEIARATGLPLGTVKSHISRGTAKLRTLLEPDGGETMSDDFEQRLRTIFSEDDDPSVSERFDGDVRARIARIRRARSMRRALLAPWGRGRRRRRRHSRNAS